MKVYMIKEGKRSKITKGIFTDELLLCKAVDALEGENWMVEVWNMNTTEATNEVFITKEALPKWEEYVATKKEAIVAEIKAKIQTAMEAGDFAEVARLAASIAGPVVTAAQETKPTVQETKTIEVEVPVAPTEDEPDFEGEELTLEDDAEEPLQYQDAVNYMINRYGVSNDLEISDYLQLADEYGISIYESSIPEEIEDPSTPELENPMPEDDLFAQTLHEMSDPAPEELEKDPLGEPVQPGLFELPEDPEIDEDSPAIKSLHNLISKPVGNTEVVDDIDFGDDDDDDEIDLFNISKEDEKTVQDKKPNVTISDDDSFDLSDFNIDDTDDFEEIDFF